MNEALKHLTVFLAIAILWGGFAALVTRYGAREQARCPGYYSATYGCSAPVYR